MNTRTERPALVRTPISRDEYLRLTASATSFAEFEHGYMTLKSPAQGRQGRATRWRVEALYPHVRDTDEMHLSQGVCVDFGEPVYVPDLTLVQAARAHIFNAER